MFNNILNKSESPQDRQPPTPAHVFDQILVGWFSPMNIDFLFTKKDLGQKSVEIPQ